MHAALAAAAAAAAALAECHALAPVAARGKACRGGTGAAPARPRRRQRATARRQVAVTAGQALVPLKPGTVAARGLQGRIRAAAARPRWRKAIPPESKEQYI
mmetsp:Transcript_46237/g.128623  ORF Transcript_46237/g.128623 Transcript_46237/m.128623 type:complete len:102 (-) Transcript_46237:90-395(-)